LSGTSFSQDDLDALERALVKGVRVVKYTDKEITYRSLTDMIALRDLLRRELGCTGQTTRIFAKHCRGT